MKSGLTLKQPLFFFHIFYYMKKEEREEAVLAKISSHHLKWLVFVYFSLTDSVGNSAH